MKKEHYIIGGIVLAVVGYFAWKHHKKETAAKAAAVVKPVLTAVAPKTV